MRSKERRRRRRQRGGVRVSRIRSGRATGRDERTRRERLDATRKELDGVEQREEIGGHCANLVSRPGVILSFGVPRR